MPYQRITLRPGVTTEATQTLAEGTWSRSNLIRWRDGYLEKSLGWARMSNTALTGTCRSLHAWQDLDSVSYLACGTNSRLELMTSAEVYDITPLRDTANVAVDFSTVDTDATVTIVDASHGGATGDEVLILVPVSVGGIVLQGYYTITVVDPNTYTVEAASPATATVNNGGAVPVFDTTMGSPDIDVTLEDHGYSMGDEFEVQVSTSVGGLTIFGTYQVQSVTDPDTFVITESSNAGSTATGSENGGQARFLYLIEAGLVSSTYQQGWGTGGWGEGEWGIGEAGATFLVRMRVWSLDNFALDLLACPSGGPIYKWSPPTVTTRASLVGGTSPDFNQGIFVAMPQLQAVSWGAEVLGAQDPLLVRWSDTGDYTDWVATSTNQAGSYRLSRGSRIVGALQGPLAALLWTDVDLWQMQYVGPPFIYSFNIIGKGCGLVGPLAAAAIDRQVYWMSLQGFYVFGTGAVTPVPCALWDTIFQDINIDYIDKVVAAASSTQREIAFYYPSSGSTEIDRYVKLNTISGEWDYGELVRTAWTDLSVFGYPIGVDETGLIMQHDLTYDADGEIMEGVMAETGYVDLAEGTELLAIDQIIPDFKLMGTEPQVSLYIKTVDWPFGTPTEHGPFLVTSSTRFITMRARARQAAFRVECNKKDTWFRMGAPRIRMAPAGRVS
jgi:hypothetical protein